MFGYRHYVPVLRWKRAEWIALRGLKPEHRKHMTPLIELTPKKFASENQQIIEQLIVETALNIGRNWGKAPIFLDLGLLAPQIYLSAPDYILGKLSRAMRVLNLHLIPVTGLNRQDSYQAIVASITNTDNHGVCIRLKKNEIKRPRFTKDLEDLLHILEVAPPQTDLVFDYEIIDNSCPSFAELCDCLPNLTHWRTFSVISGAFPKDLIGFEPGQHLHSRLDWQTWLRQINSKQPISRLPTYGDYTIQHPIFSEPPKRAHFSASIRYTSNKDWVIMRGEGVFKDNGPGFAQWPANAQLLCERNEFCGSDFSEGDKYIYKMGQQLEKNGNPETWLRAGINHHLTFAVQQISDLFGI